MKFFNTKNKRRAARAGAAVVVVGLLAWAIPSTGAYFSDTKTGTVSGTVGSIKVNGSGGAGSNGLDIQYTDLLPGTPQTVTAGYTNTGLNAEDVWIVFYEPAALSALNNLGHYGKFSIASSDKGQIFQSTNLNDNSGGTCGPLSPTGCWPVPVKVQVASNVAPAAVGTFSFTFAYTSLLKGQSSAGGGVWNAYPLSSPTTAGLPYELVATQVGQTP